MTKNEFRFAAFSVLRFAAYLIASCVLFHKVAIEGSQTFMGWGDAATQTYPWLMKVWHSAANGHLALWDFGIFSGTSFAGELQTAPFYPVAWAFAGLANSNPHVVDLFLILHFALAAYFMHEFLRAMDLPPLSCIIGSILFAFVSPVTLRVLAKPNLFCSLVFMPATALCTLKALNSNSRDSLLAWTLFGGISLALSILAGHVHGFIHIAVCVAIFCVIYQTQTRHALLWRTCAVFAGLCFSSLCGCAVQLASTKEYLNVAYKFYTGGFTTSPHVVPFSEIAHHAIPLSTALTALSPDISGSNSCTLFITYTGLALMCFSLLRIKSFASALGWVVVLISFFLASAGSPLTGLLIYHLPILNLVREPDRAFHLYAFGAAVCAASGAKIYVDLVARVSPKALIAQGFLLLMFIFEVISFDGKIGTPVASAAAPTAQFLNDPLLPILAKLTARDNFLYRVGSLRPNLINENAGEVIPIFNSSGYRATMLGSYYDYRSSISSLNSPKLDLMSIRYILSDEEKPALTLLGTARGIYVYERKSALPIFWNLDSQNLRRHDAIGTPIWRDNSVSITLSHPLEGSVVFSQPSFPGWKAFVDGRIRTINTYGIFMSIPVSPGDKLIRLSYSPNWLLPFGLLSFATFALGSMLAIAVFYKALRA